MTRRLHILFFTLVAFLALTAQAQEEQPSTMLPDSLVSRLKEFRKADYQRAEALDACIEYAYDNDNISSVAPYVNELEQLANTLNDNYWIAKGEYFQAIYAYEKGNMDQTFSRLNRAMQIAETLQENNHSQALLARIHLLQSAAYMNVGLLPDAYESVENGLAIADKYGFVKLHNKLINNKSAVAYSMGELEESLNLMKELYGQDSDEKWLRNIADLYCELGDCDAALGIIDSVYQNSWNDVEKMDILLAKCFVLNRMQRWSEAEQCMLVLDGLNVDNQGMKGLAYMRWSEVYCGLYKLPEALLSIDSALVMAKNTGNAGMECNCLQKKANILKEMGNHQAALETKDAFWMLYDTISERNNKSKVTALRYQQEFSKIKQQYEAEHEMLRLRQTFIYIIAGILVVFAVVFALIVWKNKKRKEEMLKLELDYRNREITSKTLNQTQLDETLNEVVQDLTYLAEHPYGNDSILPSAIRRLKGLENDDSKKEFDYYFVEVHPDFYANLKKDFPELTPNELRLCAFAKLNLPLKKIAEINHVSIDSVKSSRKRLRKSLGIEDPKIDLSDFLAKY